jgi:1-acyl-sn-glycerol-3-phosphate acyltransferase
MLDEISEAVLSREELLKYPREQVNAYLDELRTTQRHKFYRALQHPLYPILRKIERKHENLQYVIGAVRAHRIIYASNHKSHTDYLVEPLVLDDNGIRPPLIAAGINLFGGPLGLIHKHVTGAIPIRRNSKDPLYLVTLRAYIAEVLRRSDLLYYAEGGRSYSGELKSPKTGLLQAALLADRAALSVVPMAVAYDLVLEERVLAREALRKRKRPFAQEVAEMIRHAVGYRSRAFVTFGAPIPLAPFDPESRRDLVALTHRVHDAVGGLYKVLPTALVATAMRPNISRADLTSRLDDLVGELASAGANLAVTNGRDAADDGIPRLIARGVLVDSGSRLRVRDRIVLRYYARTIQHLRPRPGTTH